MDIDELLVDLKGLRDDEVEAKGKELYEELYINKGNLGVHNCHDGEEVVFWKDRYEHAFYSSDSHISNRFKKDKIARDRIERIHWIGKVIVGELPDTECWLVNGKFNRSIVYHRLYILWPKRYVVWLEKAKGCWKFSSAYVTSSQNIRRYCKTGSRKIWTYADNKNKNAP